MARASVKRATAYAWPWTARSKLCLGQEDKLQVRPLLRAGVSDETLEQAIVSAIARKPERHELSERPEQFVRFISTTGG